MDPAQRERPSRLGWACDRCRRQKLKCDVEKPCIMCVRAGFRCEPQPQPSSLGSPPPLKRKRSAVPSESLQILHAPATADSTSSTSPYAPQCVPDHPLENSSRSPINHFGHLSTSSSSQLVGGGGIQGGTDSSSSRPRIRPPEDSQQYGANDSTMGFAKIILGEDDDENDSPASGAIPGDAGCTNSDSQLFPWISTPLPSQTILQVAIDAYFDRVNWYIMLFHQPSFVVRAGNILRRSAWRREELCDVLLVAMVAAMGLRCVEFDETWPGHRILEAYSTTAKSLGVHLVAQIGSRFYEAMLCSQIEVYQLSMLLTTYHVYFGSSNFAWNVSGVNTKTAYALAMHCDKARATDNNEIAREVSNRCWNHLIVSEQFSSMIFGRPAGLDPAFAQLKELAHLDDTELPESTAALPILQQHEGGQLVSFLTYHTLKFELYDIIRQTLQSFKMLQSPSPVPVQDLKALIQILNATETMLSRWHDNLPAVFKPSQWSGNDPWQVLALDQCTPEERNIRRRIGLQGFILQLLYDAARVWAHRPLLKLRISISPRDGNNAAMASLGDIPDSLGASVHAALRMSRIPVHEFEGQLAQSFVLMHLFTAGIILCIAPTCQPYSQVASDAKAGVLRIIAACRGIKDGSKIAKHTDRMLTRLYLKTMQREMDNALRAADVDVSGADWKSQGPKTTEKQYPHQHQHQQQESRPAAGGGAFGGLLSTQASSTSQPRQLEPDVTTPTPSTSTGHSSSSPARGYSWLQQPGGQQRAPSINGLTPDQPVVSYVQFESLRHADRMTSHVDEHLDEAYGAFEQMFNLDFADFPFDPS